MDDPNDHPVSPLPDDFFERPTASLPGIKAYSTADVVEPYWRWLRSVMHDHPALIFSLGYLFLASVGICYDFWLYRAFDINVLDFAEAGDFLLAAVRQPMVIVLGIGSFLIILGLHETDYRLRRRFPRYRQLYKKASRVGSNVHVLRALLTGMAIWYFVALFTPFYAAHVAGVVQSGSGRKVMIRTSIRPGEDAARVYALIGTTNKFLFVYDLKARTTHVFPNENVEEIVMVPSSGEVPATAAPPPAPVAPLP